MPILKWPTAGFKPLVAGNAGPGVSNHGAREDHIHDNKFDDVLLFQLLNKDVNVTTDSLLAALFTFATYQITRIRVSGSTIASLNLAAGGVYLGAGKAGPQLVATAQTYAAINAAGGGMDLTMASPAAFGELALATGLPNWSLTTAQGAAGTANIRIYGAALT